MPRGLARSRISNEAEHVTCAATSQYRPGTPFPKIAINAAVIAILGTAVPGRVWLIAVHLTLSGSLLLLNRARRPAGILRVVRDWHPLMLFPLLYKEVELVAAVIGDWRLTAAIPTWESALFDGQPSQYLSERLALVPLS